MAPIGTARVESWKAFVRHADNGAEKAEMLRRLAFNFHGRERGDWQEAVRLLNSALLMAPDDPRLLEDAGRALVVVGQKDRGIELLRRSDSQVARSFLEKFGW